MSRFFLSFLCLFVSPLFAAESPKMNPDISLNGLFLYRGGDTPASGTPSENGFGLQEAELQIMSNVDPYIRANVILAVEPETDPVTGEVTYEVAPEEAYLESLDLPTVTLRLGKFKSFVGKLNAVHTHALPFLDTSIVNTAVLGDEGLNETGLSVAFLTPFNWYSELVLQVTSAENAENFGTLTKDDVASNLHWKNLWDLSDSASLEWLSNYVQGSNPAAGITRIYGTALTAKWKPSGRKHLKTLSWTSEFLKTEREDLAADAAVGGLSHWLQWQFAQRWWLSLRHEYLGLPSPDVGATRRASALLAFVPSEFSALRLQYDHSQMDQMSEDEQRITFQMNFTVGVHPAHGY